MNPFPWQYRSDCVRESAITCLQNFPPNSNWPPFPDGDALLLSLMQNAARPVTLLVTCPFTPIMNLLQQSPELGSKIEQFIWMSESSTSPAISIPRAASITVLAFRWVAVYPEADIPCCTMLAC